MSDAPALILAVSVLAVSLVAAVARPPRLHEAVVAAAGAAGLVAVGAISAGGARDALSRLGPTVGFLGALLVLAEGCRRDGLFEAIGALLAGRARGRPRRLLALVFGAATAVTAVLGLDATVVLLTPIVFATAARMRTSPRPHVYACSHLANSASLLLPVSNLTNLLAFDASGLSFTRFAALMALPTAAVVAVEWRVFSRFFATELDRPRAAAARADSSAPPRPDTGAPTRAHGGTPARANSGAPPRPDTGAPTRPHSGAPARANTGAPPRTDATRAAPARANGGGTLPRWPLAVLAATLAGFAAGSALGIAPVWIAAAGATAITLPALLRGRAALPALARAAEPGFLVFVLALGVIVEAASRRGLESAIGAIVPSGDSLADLLLVAAGAAVLANLVNNLPATLALVPVAAVSGPAVVLAVLIGVNVGPNLTYAGSLATLLWRRVLHRADTDVELGEFVRLGALTVPASLVAATVLLWFSAQGLL